MASRSTLRRLHTFTAERRCAGRNVNGTQWVINPRGIAKHYAFGLWFPLDFFSVLTSGQGGPIKPPVPKKTLKPIPKEKKTPFDVAAFSTIVPGASGL